MSEITNRTAATIPAGRDRIASITPHEGAEAVRALLLSLGEHVEADPHNTATIICPWPNADQVMADAYFECVASDGKVGVWRAGPSD